MYAYVFCLRIKKEITIARVVKKEYNNILLLLF